MLYRAYQLSADIVQIFCGGINRMLGDGKTVGEILAEQMAAGQNNYVNPYSALYDLDIFLPLMHALIVIAAVGAFMNVIPYFWYDINERKQQSVIRVLKVRAMYEDYGNGALKDEDLVEGVDIITCGDIDCHPFIINDSGHFGG